MDIKDVEVYFTKMERNNIYILLVKNISTSEGKRKNVVH